MRQTIRSYELLSESAGCDLRLIMSNASGPDHVAARAYHHLLLQLRQSNVLKLSLRAASSWAHVLGLAAVCADAGVQLEIHVDASQKLSVASLFAVWGACRMGARVQRAPFTGQFVREITAAQEQSALQKAVSELLSEVPADCAVLVIPCETSCFSRCDFTLEVHRQFALRGSGELQIVTLPEESENDYLCWVQTFCIYCNYGQFFWEIARGGAFDQKSIAAAFDFLPEKLIPDIQYANFDEMEIQLFEQLNRRFQECPELSTLPAVLEVTHSEWLDAFRQFTAQSHTLASGSFLAGLAGILSKKFAFGASERIYCWITGSIQTCLHQQDFLAYIYFIMQLALQKAYEIIDIAIECDVDNQQNTQNILEILDTYSLSVQNWKFHAHGVNVACISPGYQALVTAIERLSAKFGAKAVECKQIPRRAPPMRMLQMRDYSEEIGRAEPYVSSLKQISDITPESVKAAEQRLQESGSVDKTAILSSQHYDRILGRKIYFIMENLQQTGSFKIRGATNMLLKAKAQNEHLQGIVACSAGNHAQGCAKTAKKLGVKCTIVCPETAPATKLLATQRYGAEVIKHGQVFDTAQAFAEQLALKRNWLLIPPFNGLDVIEGQATIAYEMWQHVQPDTVLVNVGGGGMIAGITQYLKSVNDKVKIIAIQAEKVFPFEGYEKSHQLREVDKSAVTIADGCNVKVPGGIHTPIFDKISQFVSVSENEIAATIVNFMLATKTITEGAGCMGLAALLYKKYIPQENEKIAVIVCGGNIDLSRISLIYKTGMISLGRYLSMKLLLPNGSGQLLKLMKIVQKYGGICDKIRTTRNDTKCDWDRAWMTIAVKTPCMEACEALKAELLKNYPDAVFQGGDVILK